MTKRLCCLVQPIARCKYCHLPICLDCDYKRSGGSLFDVCEGNKYIKKGTYYKDGHFFNLPA